MQIIQSNKLFACGSNGNGQLGIGSFEDTNIPTACKFYIAEQLELQEFQQLQKRFNSSLDTKPRVITGGGNHSAIITSSGELWMSGLNFDGQCGIASEQQGQREPKINIFKKVEIHEVKRWKHITCGWNFSLAVEEENGYVYSFGKGVFGELGCSESVKETGGEGVRIKGIKGVEKVICGLRHVICLNNEGKCFGWGSNKFGQLTKFDKDNNNFEESDKNSHRKKKGILYFEPIEIFRDWDLKVVDVACGQYHTVLMTSDGEVFTFGLNKYGQLGYDFPIKLQFSDIPKKIEHGLIRRAKSIHCGWNNTIVICEGSKLFIWGRNDHGQCGKNNPKNDNGKINMDGWIDKPVPLYYLPQNLMLGEGFGIEECVCGSEHTLIMSKQGECLSWGWNEHGNCGIGDNENRWQPEKVKKVGDIKKVGGGCGNSWIWVQETNESRYNRTAK
ncbi:regulator of chromosome condensation 1/beta-lactamase-inhibitor protein II [Glomus cerebriforme]|uniref:Regulator of chromosome condensation 1/beta-lactamase-inhibitor protein II n=1 Tax=Glomus cerebriforme TaxID=658196 RepID=A0A397SG66_9GLOM|nr:regulator of chromosome condensation 1/beta-lactamase-inhibitor protein II [Glomus cerebriforme]